MTTIIVSQNKLTSSLGEYFDNSNWVNNNKSEFIYDSNKNLTAETEFYWDYSNSKWTKSYASFYTYNANNKVTIELSEHYNTNGTLFSQYRTTNAYDSNGKLIEILYEFNGGSLWEIEDKFILEYNTNNELSGAIAYQWNGSNWVFGEDSSKITLSYNSNNKVSISKSDSWDNTKWVDSDRTVYTYDSNDRIIIEDGQSWDGTNWVTDYKSEYTYDSNGNAVTEKESYLDNGVLTEQPVETITFDTSQLMANFSHPYKDKTGIDFIFSANGIVNKILSRSNTNYRTTYNYNEVTASTKDITMVDFDVYPNPATSFLTIDDANFTLKKVELYNVLGKKVLTSSENKINIQNLTSGVYLLKVETEKGIIATKRIVKK
ncbi:hypothetical protein BW723_15175 [Polaribacter reichenbachii]|uniref:Secretion system C-terminal sorting domain-containing protein n=2 Tax=Polaribacter reichenbachii TaxID=996801 RepID=A0A1B8U5G6_9FLAO|nr:hypothetical protein BW723_15175 [Polaribacter reichenbachii]AUC18185.1 hypothetical protein BTO17_05620 [Polaribacter reichenbachii]OBY67102.1 hypothetical protein LPB301_04615 [Polaribacter reichenbachii]